MRRKVARRRSRGFTLMELMVVLSIIAMLAVFALPRLSKSVGKTKLTEGVSALASVSAQIEAMCATRGAGVTTAAQVANLMSSMPTGFKATAEILGTAAACADNYGVKLAGLDGLPDLCIRRRTGGQWKYEFKITDTGKDWSAVDIPIPTGRLQEGTCAAE